ncbi:MAG TPA: 4-alpha-glucanotransferase [Bryobacteraceae bacterium]|nr:4-alpha-glucanotransferase [Bryobacteraceae bacterium]
MGSQQYQQLLDRAARLWGIEPEFWDIWGNLHVASNEVKRSLLKGMGVDAETESGLEGSLQARYRREWTRLVAPCLVVGEQGPVEFFVNAPEDDAGDLAAVEVRLEDGREERFDVPLINVPEAEAASFDGCRRVRKMVRLPFPPPLGYHDVTVSLGGETESMRLIVTPERAYTPAALANGARGAGIAIALYGVRSARNWGCGDFTDLRAVTDWVADDLSAGFIALNPLHAIHNRKPFNTSPYLPNCVFYQNFLYLDVEAIPDFAVSARANAMLASDACGAEIEALRGSEFVEYERVAALKVRFLKVLFMDFLHREYYAGRPRARQFREYVLREGELLDRFATYCALDQYIHRRNPDAWLWTQWPEQYREPDSEATRAFARRHWRAVLFHKYVQWQIDVQLEAAQRYTQERGLAIGLYHDLALATDRFGSDLWAHRPFYVEGCRVGSPPDDFSPKGQDWGFPPPSAEHHRETGYGLFAESIRKNCRHGGALRIDHVMRFFRLYWIPEDADAAHGAYVRDRWEDLIRILALESVRNRVVVIGEDLGTVEPVVRETLARFGVLSYRLFYFEKNSRGEFRRHDEYPVQALVSSTTHDLPTLAGFWTNEDIEARRRAGTFATDDQYRGALTDRLSEKQKMLDLLHGQGLLPGYFPRAAAQVPELTGELHNAVIGFLALTPSQLLAVNQEDLTKEVAQQNLPATTWQYPNWSRKMKFTTEQLATNRLARDYTAMLKHWLERSGRLNQIGRE